MTISKIAVYITLFLCFACESGKEVTPEIILPEPSSLEKILTRGSLEISTFYNTTDYYVYRGITRGFHYDLARDFAGYLGANVNIGRIRGQYCRELDREETIGLAQNAFTELADYAAPKNVDIALETVTIMQTNFINTLAEGAAMADRVGRPNFRLMMDIFHMNLEEKDLYEAIRTYSSYNIHVHLADNNRRYPGQCGLDFEKILTVFRECGYDGNYCTEIFQLPSMEEAARESIRYLRPIADRVYGGNTHCNEAGRNKDGSGRSRMEGMQI